MHSIAELPVETKAARATAARRGTDGHFDGVPLAPVVSFKWSSTRTKGASPLRFPPERGKEARIQDLIARPSNPDATDVVPAAGPAQPFDCGYSGDDYRRTGKLARRKYLSEYNEPKCDGRNRF